MIFCDGFLANGDSGWGAGMTRERGRNDRGFSVTPGSTRGLSVHGWSREKVSGANDFLLGIWRTWRFRLGAGMTKGRGRKDRVLCHPGLDPGSPFSVGNHEMLRSTH